MPTETKGTTAIANVMEDLNYYVAAVFQPLHVYSAMRVHSTADVIRAQYCVNCRGNLDSQWPLVHLRQQVNHGSRA
jgi:hypothetical protein